MKYESIEQELNGKFMDKHLQSGQIIESYRRLGEFKKAANLLECGTILTFKSPIGAADVPAKLHQANFCKDRLCPMCAWRRSKKIFGQVSKIMNEIEKDYAFIFVTYTLRNCAADELVMTINQLFTGLHELHRYPALKKATKGFFRAFEITRNPDLPKCLEYHPHLHVIYAVNPSYFVSRDYIAREEMALMWEKVNKLDYYPQVFMEKVRSKDDTAKEGKSLAGAVSEVAKYCVKDAEICQGDEDSIDEAVRALSTALRGRRLCAMGGIFKQTAKELDLDDMIDGDLVLTDNEEELRKDITYMLVTYHWQVGLGYQFHSAEPVEENHDTV